MSQPVSVIIPCHNAAAWVDRQISAALAQLRTDDELVLVDNRSTDTTYERLEAAAAGDRRVRAVSAPERPGANHARNVGIAAAHNPLLLFCDADDQVADGWVEAFRSALQNAGIAGGAATPVNSDGRRLGPDLGLHEIFGGPAYPLGACMAIRKDVVNAVGGFDESFVGGHDETDLAWRAERAGWPTVFVPNARIDYLQRPDAAATVRQRRAYARTSIQLWSRHPETVDPHGVSVRAAVRGVMSGLPNAAHVLRGTASVGQAAQWGWSLGLLEGHLRYRILGKPAPARVTIPTDSR